MTTSTALTYSGPRLRAVPTGTDAKPTTADREPPRVRGFGAPADHGAHHFTVTVPAGRTEHASVQVVELRGDLTEAVILRVSLLRWRWRLIEGVLSRSFNQRLRAQHLPTGRWTRGETPVERRFGKELCVLAWAIEEMDAQSIPRAAHNWMRFSPGERWWLFKVTASQATRLGEPPTGWRVALRRAVP